MALGFTDEPDHRKNHSYPISRSGGIAIFVAFFLSSLVAYLLNWQNIPISINSKYVISLISIFAFFALGLFEDLYQSSPFLRLFIQILIAIFIYSNGILIGFIDIPFSDFFNNDYLELPDLISLIITILWIVGITNAFNWIDGLDGLAAGVTFISALNIMLINLTDNQIQTAFLSSALAGSCLGFIPENRFPAKLHMGDSGSYLLGTSISILSLLTFSHMSLDVDYDINKINIFLCLLSVAIPVFDMTYVIFNRLKLNRSPFFPDRSHLHHRILDSGFNSEQTVFIICTIVLFLYSFINLLKGNFILSSINFSIGSVFLFLKFLTIKK